MRAYVINLDSATDRWTFIREKFAGTPFELVRIPAINGRDLTLPHRDFDEPRYRQRHGRTPSLGEIGCYLSHVRALETFFATDERHALICEDDLTPQPGFVETVDAAMKTSAHWNILRLSGLQPGHPQAVASLGRGAELVINFGRLKGTGAYLVDRLAAQELTAGLLPMWVPYDHALDREWSYGLRSSMVLPFPISQTASGHRSSVQTGFDSRRLPAWQRWLTTYPYQLGNESLRLLFRTVAWFTIKNSLSQK